jgi:DNA-directed RNA polymerase specialized sigma subunit
MKVAFAFNDGVQRSRAMNPEQTDLVIRNDGLVGEIVDGLEPRVHDVATRSALLAVGRIALIDCVQMYADGSSVPFASFARPHIQEAVAAAAADRRPHEPEARLGSEESSSDESTLAAAMKLTVPQLRRIRHRGQ